MVFPTLLTKILTLVIRMKITRTKDYYKFRFLNKITW